MSEIATTLKDDLKKIPPWAYIAVGGGGLVLLMLRKRGGGVATVSSASGAVAPKDGTTLPNPTAGLDPSLFQLSPGNLPGMPTSGGPPTAAAPPPPPAKGVTFAQTLGAWLPGVYSPGGFNNNLSDTTQGGHDVRSTLGEFGQNNIAYQDALAQADALGAAGNAAGVHKAVLGLESFGGDFSSAVVAPVGLVGQIVPPGQQQVIPATGGGGVYGVADGWGRDQLYGYLGAL